MTPPAIVSTLSALDQHATDLIVKIGTEPTLTGRARLTEQIRTTQATTAHLSALSSQVTAATQRRRSIAADQKAAEEARAYLDDAERSGTFVSDAEKDRIRATLLRTEGTLADLDATITDLRARLDAALTEAQKLLG
jgi:hypothetical protein